MDTEYFFSNFEIRPQTTLIANKPLLYKWCHLLFVPHCCHQAVTLTICVWEMSASSFDGAMDCAEASVVFISLSVRRRDDVIRPQ